MSREMLILCAVSLFSVLVAAPALADCGMPHGDMDRHVERVAYDDCCCPMYSRHASDNWRDHPAGYDAPDGMNVGYTRWYGYPQHMVWMDGDSAYIAYEGNGYPQFDTVDYDNFNDGMLYGWYDNDGMFHYTTFSNPQYADRYYILTPGSTRWVWNANGRFADADGYTERDVQFTSDTGAVRVAGDIDLD